MRRDVRILAITLAASGWLACGDTGADGSTGSAGATTAADETTTGATTAADETTTGATTTATSAAPEDAQCQADVQDCPDGYKCLLRRGDADWEFVCLPANGDKQPGEACQHDGVLVGTDDCDESSWCIGQFDPLGAPWPGLCYPLCVGGECELGERCVGIGSLPVCAPICDPLIEGACGNEEACIFREPEGFVCFPQGSEGHQLGEACETGISCAPGLHCSQKVAGCAAEDYCCTDYCDTKSDVNTCAAQDQGVTCVAIGATDPTQAQVGACVTPD